MDHYEYVIVGGGMAADSAAQGIREVDKENKIAIIGNEKSAPYDRPPLTKGLWKGKPLESIWRNTSNLDIDLHIGRTITTIDPINKHVTDNTGNVYTYKKLLLATGGTPKRLPIENEEIIYFRTVDDYYKLHELSEQGQHFVVIGAGFIGSEIAAALAMNGRSVTMIFPGPSIGSRVYPPDLSKFISHYYQDKGITLIPREKVESVTRSGSQQTVTTQQGKIFTADAVIAGVGITPNIDLAASINIDINNGIIVDDFLQTNFNDIYAAGDVANFYNLALDKRLRVEHEDNANTMGRIAGMNMAGQSMPYQYQPYFYSDLFDLGYEAVGLLDSRMKIVADWEEPHQKGVIYYLDNGYVQGILLWNTWEQVESARVLIAQREKGLTAESLKGRIG